MATTWTRQRATALREAYQEAFPGTSNEDFAHNCLGIAPRTVYYWAQKDDDRAVQRGSQGALDEFFRGLSADVKAQFYARLDTAATPALRDSSTTPGEAIAVVAREATQDLVLDSASVGDALELLHTNVTRTARDYSDRSPGAELEALRSLRTSCRALENRTRRPSDRHDLFALTGLTTALLSSVAFDIGEWSSALDLAQVATSYGAMSGHQALSAWSFGLHATVLFWDNRPGQAIAAVERGLSVAPTPAGRFRLHNIAARAYAVDSQADQVARSLTLAAHERELMEDHERDPLHDELGGEFAFTDPRATACAAASWLELGNGDEAEAYAQRTLNHYRETSETLGQGPLRGASIDLASARILQRNFDGTAEVLAPILALSHDHKTISLAGRLTKTRNYLWNAQPQPGTDAHALLKELDEWLDTARKVHIVS